MIYTGTSGYSYKAWVGEFYPPKTSAAKMLGYPLEWPDQYWSVERYTPRFEFHFGGE